MAARGVYDTVKQAIQDLIAPDLEWIKGELVGVRAAVSGVHAEINAVRAEIKAVNDRIDALKDRVEQTNKRLDDTNRRLEEALDIRERLAFRAPARQPSGLCQKPVLRDRNPAATKIAS